MSFRVTEFERDSAEEAARLFLACYGDERTHVSVLPEEPLGGLSGISDRIEAIAKGGGVAAYDSRGLAGYLLAGYSFEFKSLPTSLVPEIGHAERSGVKAPVFDRLYPAIGEVWTEHGSRLHILSTMAHDAELGPRLSDFGFGAVVEERLRDISPVEARGRRSEPERRAGTTEPAAGSGPEAIDRGLDPVSIEWRETTDDLVDLQTEHARYYAGPPIFVNKNTGPDDVKAGLDELRDDGCAFLVAFDADRAPEGCFVVGPVASNAEGLLLRESNTAQVRSAYLREPYRRGGIGTAMLDRCVTWARERGFDRVFVEHETANVTGRGFWSRHFTPFVRFSMRYVDLPATGRGRRQPEPLPS